MDKDFAKWWENRVKYQKSFNPSYFISAEELQSAEEAWDFQQEKINKLEKMVSNLHNGISEYLDK